MNAENLQWFLMGAALTGAVWGINRLLRSSTGSPDDSNFGRREHAYELSRHPLREIQERYTQVAQHKPNPPAEPESPEVQPPDVEVPYGLDTRSTPEGDDVDRLLPPGIGHFKRGDPRGDVHDLTYAEYTDGHNEIWMSFAVCKSPEDARSGVDRARVEGADVTVFVETQSFGTEPSFYKSGFNNPRMGAKGKGTGIVWNRGRYFFSADALTSELLDSFMNDFPY